MTAKSLENLLNPSKDGELGSIVRRARDMDELTAVLARALPPDDSPGIVAANVRDDGELVVLSRSPAWASRLRFAAESLLDAARRHGFEASYCTVRVARAD